MGPATANRVRFCCCRQLVGGGLGGRLCSALPDLLREGAAYLKAGGAGGERRPTCLCGRGCQRDRARSLEIDCCCRCGGGDCCFCGCCGCQGGCCGCQGGCCGSQGGCCGCQGCGCQGCSCQGCCCCGGGRSGRARGAHSCDQLRSDELSGLSAASAAGTAPRGAAAAAAAAAGLLLLWLLRLPRWLLRLPGLQLPRLPLLRRRAQWASAGCAQL